MTVPDRPCSPADLTLVEFLRARLDEDERGARDLLDRTPHRWRRATDVGDWHNYAVVIAGNPTWGDVTSGGDDVIAQCGLEDDWGIATADHIARHDPARVLRDVAAKRRIVERLDHHRPWVGIRNAPEPEHYVSCVCGWQQVIWSGLDYDGPYLAHLEALGVNDVIADAVLRLLAEEFADHHDYREEWKP